MGIKWRKVCFICKVGNCSTPPRSLTLSFRLWGQGRGGLWSPAEGRYGSFSAALRWEVCSALIKRMRDGRRMFILTVATVPVSPQCTWITFTVGSRKKSLGYRSNQYIGCKIYKIISLYVKFTAVMDSLRVCDSWGAINTQHRVSYMKLKIRNLTLDML